jgi:flagellar export protein FliJ
MAGARPWSTLMMLHTASKDKIARRLGLLEDRLRQARELEEKLSRYQAETQEQFRNTLASRSVSPSYLLGSAQFYARIDDGMRLQQNEVARLMLNIEEVRGELTACNMEIMKYEKLLEKDALAFARIAAVAEQKATDNFVSAAVARKLQSQNTRGN